MPSGLRPRIPLPYEGVSGQGQITPQRNMPPGDSPRNPLPYEGCADDPLSGGWSPSQPASVSTLLLSDPIGFARGPEGEIPPLRKSKSTAQQRTGQDDLQEVPDRRNVKKLGKEKRQEIQTTAHQGNSTTAKPIA